MKFKKPIHIGIFFALIWVILRMIVYMMDVEYRVEIGMGLNLLFLPVILLLAMMNVRNNAEKVLTYLDFLKAGMRASAIYALLVCAFLFLYYGKIDQAYLDDARAERIEALEDGIQEEGGWESYRDKNEIQEESEVDFMDQQKEMAERFLSPFFMVSLSLIGLMLAALIFSLIMAAVQYRFR